MKVYVITGITGLLGRSLAWAVLSGASGIREEIQIIGIGRNLGRMQAVFPDAVRRGMTFVEADCCMMGQLSGGLERMQADYLIHCAAPIRWRRRTVWLRAPATCWNLPDGCG